MTHYILSTDTGVILQITQKESEARLLGMSLANSRRETVALHAVISLNAPKTSVSMKGVMDWFYPVKTPNYAGIL